MKRNIPEDIDADDYFNIPTEQIDKILDLYDEGNEGQERAEEEAARAGLDNDKFNELLAWFGRGEYDSEPANLDDDSYWDDHDIYGGGSYMPGDD